MSFWTTPLPGLMRKRGGGRIALVGTSFKNNLTSDPLNQQINKPSGVSEGDVLIALFRNGTNNHISPPDGWTLQGSAFGNSFLYTKIATISEPSVYDFIWSIQVARSACILAYRGSSGIDVVGDFSTTATQMNLTVPGITATQNGALIFLATRQAAYGVVSSPPAGLSEVLISDPSVGPRLFCYDMIPQEAGTIDDRTISFSNNSTNHGIMLQIAGE